MKTLIKQAMKRLFRSRAGCRLAELFLDCTQGQVFGDWTERVARFDVVRYRARLAARAIPATPPATRLHLACGRRSVQGWLNVDVVGGDCLADLNAPRLPWADGVFDTVVAQHVIEYMDLHLELIPFLRELYRVSRPGGAVWLSCPDMERVCESYLQSKGRDIIDDKRRRGMYPHEDPEVHPPQHVINEVFHQSGQHRNLFDFELLAWALDRAGFAGVERVSERRLLDGHPEFPARDDDYLTLYVRAVRAAEGVDRRGVLRAA